MSFDLSTLRGEHFDLLIGDEFQIEGVNGSLPLTLVEVITGDKPILASSNRPAFSLLFRCVIQVNIRGHEIFNLRHAKLGLLENVYIGPIMMPDPKWGEGIYWEAIFS
jgi:hypothetical protein